MDDGTYLTGNQPMEYLGVGRNALYGLIRRGVIQTNQITDFAPWRIAREELDSGPVRDLVAFLKRTGRLPKGGSPNAQRELSDKNKRLTPKV